MNEVILACPSCGTKNRVTAGAKGSPVCSACWTPLQPSARAETPPLPPTPTPPAKSGESSNKGCLWIFIIILCVGGCVLVQEKSNSRRSYTPPSTSTSSAYVPPPPIPARPALVALDTPPHGTYRNDTGRKDVAPFKITTSAGSNYYLKLVDANTGVAAVHIFVRGGSPLEVDVPLGSYRLKYAAGSVWYGTPEYFGPDTVFSEASARFDFTLTANYYSGNQVTLYRVQGGNMKTNRISKEGF